MAGLWRRCRIVQVLITASRRDADFFTGTSYPRAALAAFGASVAIVNRDSVMVRRRHSWRGRHEVGLQVDPGRFP